MSKKSSKAKSKRPPGVALQPVVRARRYAISEDRILQISNDISEGMCNAKASDLIEVVKYFRDHFDAEWQARQSERTQLALDLLDMAHPLLNPSAKQPNDPSSATRPTGRYDCNSDAMAGFAAAHG